MNELSSIFDMIGPVMIGPSSSHTAGVARIGCMAMHILGNVPTRAHITFYNSFAKTYQGHGSDRAVLGGLMGFDVGDTRIKDAEAWAKKKGLEYTFKTVNHDLTRHPNSIGLDIEKKERHTHIEGISIGGGRINISKVQEFSANISGALHTLIIFADDKKGSIAYIASVISHENANIATMIVSRKGKRAIACQVIEMDSALSSHTLAYIKRLSWVHEVITIPRMY